MKIHEYQARDLLAAYGVPVPNAYLAESPDEAVSAAKKLGGKVCVVKAQVHSGGRGKAGGVKLAHTPVDAGKIAENMLGSRLITNQTGPEGKLVRKVLITEGVEIKKEYYLSLTVDSRNECLVMIASAAGGTEIEATAKTSPHLIITQPIDLNVGFKDYQARAIAKKIGLIGEHEKEFILLARKLFKLFLEKDCSLIEINPLVETGTGNLFALDSKITFDDNAIFRHPEIAALRDIYEEDPKEVEASKYDLNYISLDGSIGCMVNGAGLAMATMDIIQKYGARPANFLDVGGGATADKVAAAFRILLSDKNVKAIMINIFGGIMKCDIIAEGVVSAAKEIGVTIPLIVRLEGTNSELGRKILNKSELNIISAEGMADAAEKSVASVTRRSGK